jgi:hypothetical protein
MISLPRLLAVVLLLSLDLAGPAVGATISVIIPAKAPSLPAQFDWTFTSANGQPAQSGQFACGSYWVAPAAGDDGVIFVSLSGEGGSKAWLTCDADPITEKTGLLSGQNKYGNHDPAENLLPTLPQTFKPAAGSCVSLVAAKQRDEAASSKGGTKAIEGEVVDAYCVVTVLPAAPKDGGKNAIRPNITGATKELLTWDDFDLTRLPKHDFLKGRTAEQWEGARIRWSHSTEVFGGLGVELDTPRSGKQFAKFSEGGRAFRSALLVSNYASGTAREFNGDLLTAFAADNKLEDMKPALAAMISYGLDIYHTRYNSPTGNRRAWSSGAGQSLGAFLPPVFAAALLKDPGKVHQLQKAAITNHSADRGEQGPQELRQIKRGVTGVLLWGDGQPIPRPDGAKSPMTEQDWRYWGEFAGSKCYDGYDGPSTPNPNQGKKTAADPYGYIDGPGGRPGSNYMGVTVGGYRAFAAAMILMPEIRTIVNSDAPIEYADRLTRHGLWTWPDPVAIPAKVDRETAKLWWKAEGVAEWQKTWGPRPDDVRFAIEDGNGRFKSLHGHKSKGGYETAVALEHWDQIVALYKGEKFEDNAVELGIVVRPEIFFAAGDKQAHLTCATPDAVIRYTVDGSDPTAGSPAYEGKPIDVKPGTTVKALAECAGKKTSAVRSKTLTP